MTCSSAQAIIVDSECSKQDLVRLTRVPEDMSCLLLAKSHAANVGLPS